MTVSAMPADHTNEAAARLRVRRAGDTVKAIETEYAGCRFRSRLEARWAVFFDTLNIEWRYETEGYEIPREAFEMEVDGVWEAQDQTPWRYLPDFYLPQLRRWVEVKGDERSLTDNYLSMIARGIDYDGLLKEGVLFLGEIPDVTGATYVLHNDVRHHKGLIRSEVAFTGSGFIETPITLFTDLDYGDGHNPPPGITSRPRLIRINDESANTYYKMVKTVTAAYTAARQARFEFGETPQRPQRPNRPTPSFTDSVTAEARRRLAERIRGGAA